MTSPTANVPVRHRPTESPAANAALADLDRTSPLTATYTPKSSMPGGTRTCASCSTGRATWTVRAGRGAASSFSRDLCTVCFDNDFTRR